MRRSRTPRAHGALATALLICAALRAAVGSTLQPSPTHAAVPALPALVLGDRGQPRKLDPSEARLASKGSVSLQRQSYGSTDVALLSVASGIKELHPPAACLEAAGYEIISTAQLQLGDGCLNQLRVRSREGELRQFYFAYLSQDAPECGFWRRTAAAVWDQLAGRDRRWSTLQVMDTDADRARRVALALIEQLSNRSGGSHGPFEH
jgi:hypothetical protein